MHALASFFYPRHDGPTPVMAPRHVSCGAPCALCDWPSCPMYVNATPRASPRTRRSDLFDPAAKPIARDYSHAPDLRMHNTLVKSMNRLIFPPYLLLLLFFFRFTSSVHLGQSLFIYLKKRWKKWRKRFIPLSPSFISSTLFLVAACCWLAGWLAAARRRPRRARHTLSLARPVGQG